MKEADYIKIVSEIREQGFSVVKKFFSIQSIEEYKKECDYGFDNAPCLEGKIYVEGKTPDYTQPWMIDREKHLIASWRLYQFYHNKHSRNTEEIISKVLNLKDKIESNWPEIAEYNKKNNFVDYNIVAKYSKKSGSQSIHSDAEKEGLSSPALQAEIYLTEPEIDYLGGDLLLHTEQGKIISSNNDLKLRMGDLLLFDKRLMHEVTETFPVDGGKGRYMALIAAKTFPRAKRNYWLDRRLKLSRFIFLNFPRTYKFLKKIAK